MKANCSGLLLPIRHSWPTLCSESVTHMYTMALTWERLHWANPCQGTRIPTYQFTSFSSETTDQQIIRSRKYNEFFHRLIWWGSWNGLGYTGTQVPPGLWWLCTSVQVLNSSAWKFVHWYAPKTYGGVKIFDRIGLEIPYLSKLYVIFSPHYSGAHTKNCEIVMLFLGKDYGQGHIPHKKKPPSCTIQAAL